MLEMRLASITCSSITVCLFFYKRVRYLTEFGTHICYSSYTILWYSWKPRRYFFVLYGKYPDSTANKKDPYFLSVRSLYGAWTKNRSHYPSHACPTPDAPGVAACDYHTCWACPTGPDYFTRGRSGADCPHCHHGRDQPALCLQVGAAVSAGGSRGIGRPTRSRPSACVVPACPAGAARRGRMTRLRRRGGVR